MLHGSPGVYGYSVRSGLAGFNLANRANTRQIDPGAFGVKMSLDARSNDD
jgi:hypothetical protein